jgi:hypothetical protein
VIQYAQYHQVHAVVHGPLPSPNNLGHACMAKVSQAYGRAGSMLSSFVTHFQNLSFLSHTQ